MTFKRLNLLTVLEKKHCLLTPILKFRIKFEKISEGMNISLRINILLYGNPFYKFILI